LKTFVVGDIHGAHLALKQVLERSNFNIEEDQLITLGDICDGRPYVYECVEILLPIKNTIHIMGNHDGWFRKWLTSNSHPDYWIQGGYGTAESYLRRINMEHMIYKSRNGYIPGLITSDIPDSHWKFFMYQNLYYKDDSRNYFFVHGGFDRWKSVSENKSDHPSIFYWDRDLWKQAMSCGENAKLVTIDNFDTIFIGHTPTVNWRSKEKITENGIIIPKGKPNTFPMFNGGVWNIDTGAGWNGKLTIMNVDTKEYWQSDLVSELYKEEV